MAQDQRSSDTPAVPGSPFAANGMAQAQHLAQSVMRGNMELVGLASRRVRANMDFSRQALACRSPAEFGQIGGQFWRDALQDYAGFHSRMMALWLQGMTAAGQGDLARQAAGLERRLTEPMAEAAEQAVARMGEQPADPWSWWAAPGSEGARASGNGRGPSEPRAARANY